MALRSAPHWSRTVAGVTTAPVAIALPSDWNEIKVETDQRLLARLGSSYTPTAVAPVPGVYTLLEGGTPTGGGFQIRWLPQEAHGAVQPVLTAQVAYNDSAATVKTKMIAASPAFVATGDFDTAGGPLPAAVTLTFKNGGVYEGVLPALDIVNDALTAASGTPHTQLTMTTKPLGNGGYGYIVAGTQEIFETDGRGNTNRRFLYVAAASTSANVFITVYR